MATEQTDLDKNIFASVTFDPNLTAGDKADLLADAFKNPEYKGDFEDFMDFLAREQMRMAKDTLSVYPDGLASGYTKMRSAVDAFQESARSLESSVKANTPVSAEQKKNLIKSVFSTAAVAISESEKMLARMRETAKPINVMLEGNESMARIYGALEFATVLAGIPETDIRRQTVQSARNAVKRNVDSLIGLRKTHDSNIAGTQKIANTALDYAASASVNLLEIAAQAGTSAANGASTAVEIEHRRAPAIEIPVRNIKSAKQKRTGPQ